MMSVDVADTVYQALQDIAKHRDVPVEQVLADVVSLGKLAVDVKDEGGQLLVDRRGSIERVELP